jgi:hypothetical protein
VLNVKDFKIFRTYQLENFLLAESNKVEALERYFLNIRAILVSSQYSQELKGALYNNFLKTSKRTLTKEWLTDEVPVAKQKHLEELALDIRNYYDFLLQSSDLYSKYYFEKEMLLRERLIAFQHQKDTTRAKIQQYISLKRDVFSFGETLGDTYRQSENFKSLLDQLAKCTVDYVNNIQIKKK